MLRRVAQDLFWIGRYFERADCLARLVFAQRRVGLEVGPPDQDPAAWMRCVLACAGEGTAGLEETARPEEPRRVLACVVLSRDAENSIARCIARARDNARSARPYLSRETYESLNRLHLMLGEITTENAEWSFILPRIEQACRVVSGFLADTVVRDEAWLVLSAGRHLERGFQTVRIVRAAASGHDGRPWQPGARIDPLAWAGLLRSCSAYEAYRKLYRGPIDAACALELLLFYPSFPRSLRGALLLLQENLVALGFAATGWRPSMLDARFNRLLTEVAYGGVRTLGERGLLPALDRYQAELAAVGAALEEVYMDPEGDAGAAARGGGAPYAPAAPAGQEQS
jgi:uncharacterized alpha-E superfamily protein